MDHIVRHGIIKYELERYVLTVRSVRISGDPGRSGRSGIGHRGAVGPRDATLTRLETDELDPAIIGAEPPGLPLRSRALCRERFIGLVRARRPLATGVARNAVTMDGYLSFPNVMVSFRDPRRSPIDARLTELGRTLVIAVTTLDSASYVASIRDTDPIMSLPSKLAAGTGRGELVRFDLPLDGPDNRCPMTWLRDVTGVFFVHA